MPRPNDDREGFRCCRDCGSWRPLSEFHTSSRRPGGRGSYCQLVKPLDDFPRNRADSTGYANYCKPCHNARTRATKQRLYGGSREYHLRRRYGIGQKEFDVLLAAQDGVCAICVAEQPEHVDHDHVSGYIRGICFNCNGGLGHFRDDMTRMNKAITYLTATSRQREIRPGVHLVLSPRQGMHPVLTHRGGRTR